jgi:hypothetical protein
MPNRNTALLLAGAAAVGGFAVGKAAIDHMLASRGPVVDEDDFVEAHYRAAGFTRSHRLADDLVAYGAGIAGIIAVVAGIPTAVRELERLMGES